MELEVYQASFVVSASCSIGVHVFTYTLLQRLSLSSLFFSLFSSLSHSVSAVAVAVAPGGWQPACSCTFKMPVSSPTLSLSICNCVPLFLSSVTSSTLHQSPGSRVQHAFRTRSASLEFWQPMHITLLLRQS